MALKWKDFVYLEDQTKVPYLKGKIKQPIGCPPIFMDNPLNTYGIRIENDDSLLELMREVLEIEAPKPQFITLRSQIYLNDGHVEKHLLEMTRKMELLGWDIPVFWSMYSESGDFVTGVHVENLLSALETEPNAYQFSIALQTNRELIKIDGRKFPSGLEIDTAYGCSKSVSSATYEKLFGKKAVGTPTLSYLTFEEAKTSKVATNAQYIGGLWTYNMKPPYFTAEGQPSVGFFSIDSPGLENLVEGIEIPPISYGPQWLAPINYGVSSAVAFISRKREMTINRAHHLEGTFSLSACDPPDKRGV